MLGKLVNLVPRLLFALVVAFSGVACVTLAAPIREVFGRLQLPLALAVFVGGWKLVGAVALFVPRRPRLKEWVFSGFCFLFSGAVFLHLAAGDGLAQTSAPLCLLIFTLINYGLFRRSYVSMPTRDFAVAQVSA